MRTALFSYIRGLTGLVFAQRVVTRSCLSLPFSRAYQLFLPLMSAFISTMFSHFRSLSSCLNGLSSHEFPVAQW